MCTCRCATAPRRRRAAAARSPPCNHSPSVRKDQETTSNGRLLVRLRGRLCRPRLLPLTQLTVLPLVRPSGEPEVPAVGLAHIAQSVEGFDFHERDDSIVRRLEKQPSPCHHMQSVKNITINNKQQQIACEIASTSNSRCLRNYRSGCQPTLFAPGTAFLEGSVARFARSLWDYSAEK